MDEKKKQTLKQKKMMHKIIVIFLLLAVMVGLTIWLFPHVLSLRDPVVRDRFNEVISQLGIKGWFLMLGIQVLQIIVAIIPGEPVEIISGVLYGTFGGLLTCLLGILIGSIAVFYLVRWLGYPLVKALVGEDKLKEYKFLNNTEKLEIVTFLLMFIPGTPKDVLTYVAGLTNIRPLRFFLISTFARIPSVITSTLAGATLGQGHLFATLLIFAITGVIGIGGILLHKKLMSRYNRSGDSK